MKNIFYTSAFKGVYNRIAEKPSEYTIAMVMKYFDDTFEFVKKTFEKDHAKGYYNGTKAEDLFESINKFRFAKTHYMNLAVENFCKEELASFWNETLKK